MWSNALLPLIPGALWGGWYFQRWRDRSRRASGHTLPPDYFVGLNYLLNEEPDRAIDAFIRLLSVDSHTVETHLALGSLFRRRGEVERAIRIHQNLIARPKLDPTHRIQALLALGQDYLRAGVLDRSERLLQEVIEWGGDQAEVGLLYLLEIYEQEKNWEKAIETAQRYAQYTQKSMHSTMAHYHCELAESSWRDGSIDQAFRQLRRAWQLDQQCVRADLLAGEISEQRARHKEALAYFLRVREHNPSYFSEAIPSLVSCYQSHYDDRRLRSELEACLAQAPSSAIIIALANCVLREENLKAAVDYLTEALQKYPSLAILHRRLSLQCEDPGMSVPALMSTRDLIGELLACHPSYRCQQCGFSGQTLYWHCPSCHRWQTIEPREEHTA